MGERCNRTAEVRGSIPLSSTSLWAAVFAGGGTQLALEGRMPVGLAAGDGPRHIGACTCQPAFVEQAAIAGLDGQAEAGLVDLLPGGAGGRARLGQGPLEEFP